MSSSSISWVFGAAAAWSNSECLTPSWRPLQGSHRPLAGVGHYAPCPRPCRASGPRSSLAWSAPRHTVHVPVVHGSLRQPGPGMLPLDRLPHELAAPEGDLAHLSPVPRSGRDRACHHGFQDDPLEAVRPVLAIGDVAP